MFINFLVRGGAEVQMLRIAQRLRDRGEDVTLLAIEPPRALEHGLQESTVPSIVLMPQPRRFLKGAYALTRAVAVLRRIQPDILITAVYQATVLGRVAGRLARVPVIVSSLRNERQASRVRDLLLRVTAPLDHWTTTNSSLAGQRLSANGIVRPERLDVIPNALSPDLQSAAADNGSADVRERERAAVRSELGVGDEAFLWLAIGRLEPQKDFGTLLEAFAHVEDGHRRQQLAVVGTGRLDHELRSRAEAADLATRACLLGPRDDVPRLLMAADGLVLSSLWEGLPNVVMEAMAFGLPVVATHVGGVPELVADGTTGVLVPPGDAGALATAMQRVGRMAPQELAEWGARGRRHVRELCDPEDVTQRWLDLMDRLAPGAGVDASGERRG